MDNLVAAAARLEAIPIEGDSPQAVETRWVKELLRTSLVQQEAYSYSNDRIHSTPRPSWSYSRHMDEPAVSSNERRGAPHGNNLAGGADNAQEVVDRARARREAELAAQYQARPLTPVRPTISVEPGVTSSSLGCLALSPLYTTCTCPRISRAHAMYQITRRINLQRHGWRAMRWPWRSLMWMMRHV